MTVGTIADYLRYGTLSARPASPSITAVSSGSARYYATDTKTDYVWDGSAWQPVGIYDTVVSKSANYTVVAADNNATLIANAASLVFTLPAPATAGAGWWVIVKNNGQTTTGIKTNTAGVLIDGVDCSSTAFTTGLTTAQGAVKLQTDGTAWYSVAMDGGSSGGGAGALTLISSQTLSTTAASVTFSSIPGTYKDLIFALMVRSDAASATPEARFNGDTGANYDWQQAWSNASSAGAGSTAALTSMSFGVIAVSGSLAGAFTQIEGRIVGYASTSFQKLSQSRTSQFIASGVGNVTNTMDMNRWNNTAAITSITFLPSAGNFIAGCQLTLWGVN